MIRLSSQKWIYLFIVSMIFLNGFILYKLTLNKKKYNDNLYKIELFKNNQFISYENNFNLNLANDGINLESITLSDTLHKNISIGDLFYNKNHLLICRLSELYCQECVTYSIVKLIKASETIGKNNIVFLCSYENSTSLHFIKEHFGIQEMPIYHISGLNIPAEGVGYPYYFILDTTLTISNIFMPDKSVPNLTNNYLNTMKNRYFINAN